LISKLDLLTGSHKVPFKESKIKVNVDHVGLSPLLLPPSPTNLSKMEISEITLNNNSFLVPQIMMDVTEVWKIQVYNITLTMVSVPKNLIHIPLEVVQLIIVKKILVKKILSDLAVLELLMVLQHFKELVTFNQCLLPLMLKVGLPIVGIFDNCGTS